MRLIAHISDLHFGRHDAAVTEGLLADLAAQQPDLIALSGDLTQRARHCEFAAARDFLGKLAAPVVAVPGNHDVPLYDLARRAFRPLTRFARYITDAEHPLFADSEIAVLGISTARSLALANGRISRSQMDEIRGIFARIGETGFRILVTHHPLILPPHASQRAVVGRAAPALEAVADAGVELLLTGHTHETFTGDLIAQPLSARRSILVSQAGTAISTRLREEVNSYNLIRIAGREQVAYEQRSWNGKLFAPTPAQRYAKDEGRWVRLG